MPIDILICEGESGSPDIRLINSILQGCVNFIVSGGGKNDLPKHREIRSSITPQNSIKCLRDCDFDPIPENVNEMPINWLYASQRQHIGWIWERKEIENYIIDPRVVQRAFSWNKDQIDCYQQILENAASTLGEYTAARATLSSFRRPMRLPNNWSEENCGLRGHTLPSDRSEQNCRHTVESLIRGRGIIDANMPDQAIECFNNLLDQYCHNGNRSRQFLTYYAGKDLLGAMNSGLMNHFTMSPTQFRERIIRSIERAVEPWNWLPEWTELRRLVQLET